MDSTEPVKCELIVSNKFQFFNRNLKMYNFNSEVISCIAYEILTILYD